MYTFVDSIEDLKFLNQELLSKSHIGVDTEFRRTTKDNMRLALLQVNDGEEIYLIDSILIEDPGDHVSFLFSKSVTKIFHSCREDIEAIYAWTNKEMINLFDTQVANSFLDGDYAIGYQGLVEQELGIILNKNETRSNWIRRPLSDSQLKYAALDVEYLIYLYEAQKKQLINASKIDWLNQDIEKILSTNTSASHSDLERIIPKAQESKLLFQFNLVVDEISKSQKINPTLFFSKKAQKDFLRLVLLEGLDIACEKITDWRRDLIKENILELLR